MTNISGTMVLSPPETAVPKTIPAISLAGAAALWYGMIAADGLSLGSISYWIALWLLLFGLSTTYASFSSAKAKLRRPLLGSALISFGGWAIYFGPIWSEVNWEDMGPNCIGGCPAGGYYLAVFFMSGVLTTLGAIAVVYGGLLLMRKNLVKNSKEM